MVQWKKSMLLLQFRKIFNSKIITSNFLLDIMNLTPFIEKINKANRSPETKSDQRDSAKITQLNL